jgi:pSer/pThr/pTyr-binding forkhead associated (FHA) protein
MTTNVLSHPIPDPDYDDTTDHPGLLTGEPPIEFTRHPTEPLAAGDHDPRPAATLLDHRTRARTVSLEAAGPGAYLSLLDAGAMRLIPLTGRVMHIGRGIGADVRLEDLRVSRHHAIIVRHGHGTRLLDNHSAAGTHVNGRRIEATNLRDGDVIELGPVPMRFLNL